MKQLSEVDKALLKAIQDTEREIKTVRALGDAQDMVGYCDIDKLIGHEIPTELEHKAQQIIRTTYEDYVNGPIRKYAMFGGGNYLADDYNADHTTIDDTTPNGWLYAYNGNQEPTFSYPGWRFSTFKDEFEDEINDIVLKYLNERLPPTDWMDDEDNYMAFCELVGDLVEDAIISVAVSE